MPFFPDSAMAGLGYLLAEGESDFTKFGRLTLKFKLPDNKDLGVSAHGFLGPFS